MSNFLLYFVQCKGVFYTCSEKPTLYILFLYELYVYLGTTHTRSFFLMFVSCHTIKTHTTHFWDPETVFKFFNGDSFASLKLPHHPSVNSVVRAIPACPAEISWSKFLDLTAGSKTMDSWRLNINIDVQSRDQTVVLESVVEVNDFSELWPSEADTASQVPLILLLSGRDRKARKKIFIFSMLLTEYWFI